MARSATAKPTKTPAPTIKDGPPGWTDRFGGKLVLVLLDNKYTPSIKKGRSLWGLHDPLAYRPGDMAETITVPAGFVTDLASIPRWAWNLLPPDGPWVKGAIIPRLPLCNPRDGALEAPSGGDHAINALQPGGGRRDSARGAGESRRRLAAPEHHLGGGAARRGRRLGPRRFPPG